MDNTVPKNPLEDIYSEVRNLMSDYNILKQKMDENQTKTELEIKKILLSFIEVSDSFENVFKNINPKLELVDLQTKSWISSFKTVHRVLLRSLGACGVVPLETIIGDKANPVFHNVTEVVEQPQKEDETIVEVVKKGYLWKGKLLRPADVKAVSNS